MKVYFHASVSQRKLYGKYYKIIVDKLIKLGYQTESTHALEHEMEALSKRDAQKTIKEDYKRVMERIKRADLVVCEISFPSTIVVGHILTRALERGKPVLCLYHADSTPALLGGLELERLIISEYSEDDLDFVMEQCMRDLISLPDQRFTMLMPAKLTQYLDEISKSGNTRSDFIRNLIEKEMNK